MTHENIVNALLVIKEKMENETLNPSYETAHGNADELLHELAQTLALYGNAEVQELVAVILALDYQVPRFYL